MERLIEKLEAAKGPCRKLDVEIAALTSGLTTDHFRDAINAIDEIGVPGSGWTPDPEEWPPYTESIDAAVTLIPSEFEWKVSNRAPKPHAGRCYLNNRQPINTGISGMTRNPKYRGYETTAATPALAICIASLRSRLNASSE